MKHTYAFSLVELSIVLVILGLLTGGILTGQNLIRAAELRSVVSDIHSFQTATMTFRDKYFAIPGDMSNATDFWGSAGGSGVIGDGCETGASSGTVTCNGNGNGQIDYSGAAADEYLERFSYWQHLTNAGLIEGAYTGKTGSTDGNDHDHGINAPTSKLANGGWSVIYIGTRADDSFYFNGEYGNLIWLGAISDGNPPNGALLSSEEAWNIDTKVDDGKPALGRVITPSRLGNCTQSGGTALTNSTTDAAKLDADYYLDSEAEGLCKIAVRNAF